MAGDDAAGRAAIQLAMARDVSRETILRLETYRQLLEKWQQTINLVGPSTIPEFWTRHVADSAQLLTLVPKTARKWVDLGSGGGFPGLVIAQIWAERAPEEAAIVHLVESDGRKCAFLRTVIRETGAPAAVHEGRIEDLIAQKPDVFAGTDIVSARALAPLPKLLDLSTPYFDIHTIGMFMKGQGWQDELTQAQQYWNINPKVVSSRTDKAGKIIVCQHPVRHHGPIGTS
jgi:16S rRNA (guanine527-N7)-methyltransferase